MEASGQKALAELADGFYNLPPPGRDALSVVQSRVTGFSSTRVRLQCLVTLHFCPPEMKETPNCGGVGGGEPEE